MSTPFSQIADATTPRFWRQPVRYMRWAAVAKPAIFWSIVIGGMGPLMLLIVPPIRYRLGDGPRERVPLTYPVPRGPRKIPEGYDD